MLIFRVLVVLAPFTGLVAGAGSPHLDPLLPPPADRVHLYRGAMLEPTDFPAQVRDGFDRRMHEHPDYSVLGPPGFWNEPSLRKHYLEDIPRRYPQGSWLRPPPFEVWLKEQQLIRAINLMSHSLELDLKRPGVTKAQLLDQEMHRTYLSALLRQTQIATVLRYARLSEELRRYEEDMYRFWASLIRVSQDGATNVLRNGHLTDHLGWVTKLAAEPSSGEDQATETRSRKGKSAVKPEVASSSRVWEDTRTADALSATQDRQRFVDELHKAFEGRVHL